MRKVVCYLGIIAAAFGLLSLPAYAGQAQPSSKHEDEGAVRALIQQWIGAYRDLNAGRLAALETPDVEVVDRFGAMHLPSGRSENEKLWSENFEVISPKSEPPTAIIDRIRLVAPDVAIVQVLWHFDHGILLTDGGQIPPLSQMDTYLVIRSHGSWLVALHTMHEDTVVRASGA